MTSIPASNILEAFGLVEEAISVSGGRGLCYRVDDIVLRPLEDDIEAQ